MQVNYMELLRNGACRDGVLRYVKQTNRLHSNVDALTLIDGHNTRGDLIWLLDVKLSASVMRVLAAKACSELLPYLRGEFAHELDYELVRDALADLDNVSPNASLTHEARDITRRIVCDMNMMNAARNPMRAIRHALGNPKFHSYDASIELCLAYAEKRNRTELINTIDEVIRVGLSHD
ncbi:hypothetical protein VPHF86_0191 [Vibrio phage F86]